MLGAFIETPSLKNYTCGRPYVNTDDKKTTMPLYLDYIKQYGGRIRAVYDPVCKLDEYAADFPAETAQCLEEIIHKRDYQEHGKFRAVVKRLYGSADPRVRDTCDNIVEKAAQMGLDWKDLLTDD